MEEIKVIKAEWNWGTKWHFYSDNSMVQLQKTLKGTEWYILGLWVNEGYRRQGLATNLINKCLEIIPEGVKAKLYVQKDCPQWLLDFYERNGFQVIKTTW